MLGNDTLPRRPRSSRSLVVTDADAVDEDTATTDTIAGTAQQNLVAGFDQYRTMAETTATTQSADDVVAVSVLQNYFLATMMHWTVIWICFFVGVVVI